MNILEDTFPIREITVYPNAARIRRIQHIALKKGENELIIKGLPEIITEESVRIEANDPANIKILDILSRDTYIENYDENKYRTEMKKLDVLVSKQKKIEAGFKNYTDEFLLFLNKENLTGTDTGDLTKTIVVNNWEDFFIFVRKKLKKNRSAARALLFNWITIQREIDIAGKNLEKFASYEKVKEHQVVARMESSKECEKELHVLYLQPGVSWYPAYTLRADIQNKSISINLFGMISQSTGEDWENVSVLLSTAIPMDNCNVPEVRSKRIKERDTSIIMTDQPFVADKITNMVSGKGDDMDVDADVLFDAKEKKGKAKLKRRDERKRRNKAEMPKKKLAGKKGFAAGSVSPKLESLSKMVTTSADEAAPLKKDLHMPGGLQRIDNMVNSIDKKVLPPFSLGTLSSYYNALYILMGDQFTPEASIPEDKKARINTSFAKGVSLEKSIGGFDYRYKVASTQKLIPSSTVPVQVSVDIKELPVTLLYITVPLEKEVAYLKAIFSNEYDNPFPAGPAQVFVDNNFLGAIHFPTLGINEGTFISLGVERDIKVIRKEKSFRKTGGIVKKGVTTRYTVEIELISYKPDAIIIEVLDRVPLSSNKAEVNVMDIEYNSKPNLITERKILLWKEKLLPKKKKVLSFSYSIKHPEDFRLTMQKGNHPHLGK